MFVKKCGRGGEIKKCGEIMGFKTTSAKSKDIVLHDNEIFRPQKLNIEIKK